MAEKRTITIHPVEKSEPEIQEQNTDESAPPVAGSVKTTRQKRVCPFCQNKNLPSYTDISTLRRYLTERARIVPKLRSGLCSKHQRVVTKQIKYARHLSLLPFTPKV